MRSKLELARATALEAGKILLGRFNTKLDIREKSINNLVTQADVESEEFIVSSIKSEFPGHGFFAEENYHDGAVSQEHLWIIDPLDGTNNYAHGIPHFCVSIAYARRGEVVAGVVYDPLRRELFSAVKGAGAFLNNVPIAVTQRASIREFIIATGFNYDRGSVMEKTLGAILALGRKNIQGIRRTGSAALDMCWVACGRFDGYFEYLLSPWDFAAAMLIVREAGGVCFDKDGKELGLTSGSVIASNKSIREDFLQVVKLAE